jgi:hypothetical protein
MELIPYLQCDDVPVVKILADRDRFHTHINELNSIIADDEELSRKFGEWIEKQINYKLSIFASYHNRYLNAAANRGYIPRPILKQELLGLINHINCEAHRDTTIGALTSIIKAK